MKTKDAKVLIISADPWRDEGGDTTAQQLFSHFPKDNLFSIYFSPEMPDTDSCGKIFQINELLFLRRLLGRGSFVGRELDSSEFRTKRKSSVAPNPKKMLFKKLSKIPFVGVALNLAREFAWGLGLWKERSLEKFLKENSINAVFFPETRWMFHSWVAKWILRKSGARLFLFFVDDTYTYTSTRWYFYPKQLLARILQRQLVKKASEVFVISPKMKREYDRVFGRETTLLTKPVDSVVSLDEGEQKNPTAIRYLYAGNLLYGRDQVLLKIAEELASFNKAHGTSHHLSIYSRDLLDSKTKSDFEKVASACTLNNAVPYSELQAIIAEVDVLVFVESFEKKEKMKTRLSFSTKITDYFKSGKLIWAVGPNDISSIEYLKENDCAFVSDDVVDLRTAIKSMMSPEESSTKRRNVAGIVEKNHKKEKIVDILTTALSS